MAPIHNLYHGNERVVRKAETQKVLMPGHDGQHPTVRSSKSSLSTITFLEKLVHSLETFKIIRTVLTRADGL